LENNFQVDVEGISDEQMHRLRKAWH
jgi:ribosomal protein L10